MQSSSTDWHLEEMADIASISSVRRTKPPTLSDVYEDPLDAQASQPQNALTYPMRSPDSVEFHKQSVSLHASFAGKQSTVDPDMLPNPSLLQPRYAMTMRLHASDSRTNSSEHLPEGSNGTVQYTAAQCSARDAQDGLAGLGESTHKWQQRMWMRGGAEAEWQTRRYLAKAKVWILSDDYIMQASNVRPAKTRGLLHTLERSRTEGRLLITFQRARSADALQTSAQNEGSEIGNAREVCGSPSLATTDSPDAPPPRQQRARRGGVFEADTHTLLTGSGRRPVGLALDGAGMLLTCSLEGESITEEELCDIGKIESCDRMKLQAPDKYLLVLRYSSSSAASSGGCETPDKMRAREVFGTPEGKSVTFAFRSREERDDWMVRLKPSREKKRIEMFAKVCHPSCS